MFSFRIILSENWDKYVYTIILCLNHIALGICLTAMSPVLVEMKDILDVPMASIALFSTFVAIGVQLGSMSAFSFKYVNRQLAVTAATTLMSLSIGLLPYSPNLVLLFLLATFLGMGSGVVNTVINVWLTEIWRYNCAPILQIPGFTFGIGTILSPIILKPYLINKNQTQLNSIDLLSTTSTTTESYDPYFESKRRHQLLTPFLIMGFIQIFFSFCFGGMFLVKRYKISFPDTQGLKTDPNDNCSENTQNSEKEVKLFHKQTKKVRIFAIAVFTAMLASYAAHENAFLTYFDTYYQYSPLKLSTTESADAIIAFSTSYTAFRLLCIAIAVKLTPKQMISTHYLIIAIGLVCLVFARSSSTMVWVANVVIGIGLSAVFPTIYSLFSQYIELTDSLGAILMLSCSLATMLPPYLLGIFIEKYSISFIFYAMTTLSLSFVMYIIVLLLIFKYNLIEKLNKSTQVY